ncbi:MAG TPA: NrfD/PsrC family molybdoenzyme membrane anchor subunit, partial [Streptosporangiaceae bacterium]|nr:NrfD/PsrC family molybdoenzyme membrane anchor subunit [Streptosporangiaceae bacterium]
VTVCPTGAILVGDASDPTSRVAQIVGREPVQVRRPEKETRPAVYYKGAHQAALDPLAARRPDGGLFAWATQGAPGAQLVASGSPARTTSSAAALLSYDVPHHAPWGWRVSLYTWTKSIAAGGFGVPVLLAFLGYLGWGSPATRWAAPAVALVFLAVTGALLIWDLKHPLRFYLIFTRHQWRSWLVRGSFIIGGYGGMAALYLLAALLGSAGARQVLAGIGLPLALATAVYTAYLFAQAKARDLWQSPLLPAQLAIQAVLAGAAVILPFLAWLSPGRAVTAAEVTLAAAAAVHVLQAVAETTLPHVTAHAYLATREMVRGRFARFFWPGLALIAASVAAPWIGVAAAPLALAGLLAYEHAFVQAGQSVPLA